MGDTESIDLETAELLDADTIPNANQSLDCFSCGEKMNGVYCYACGNKNDNYRRSIWSLGAELFASLTAFEGRIWRSLRSLIFKPGQMSREFSDGKRQKWTSPIRLYLAMSLLLFGYITVTKTQLIAFGAKATPNSIIQAGTGDKNFLPQVLFLERKSTIQKAISEDAISAFERNMANIANEDDNKSKDALELELKGTLEAVEKLQVQIETTSNKYAKAGMTRGLAPMLKRIESLKLQIKNYNEKVTLLEEPEDSPLMTKQEETENNIEFTDATGKSVRLDTKGLRNAISIGLRQPERINAPIGKYLPRIMFFMMPLSMLLGAIFIRGREKAMLFDHLVHSAYIHAFSFLLLFVFMILVQLTPIKGLLWIYMAILLVYLPLSAKRMFGRTWFKSLLTSYGVGAIYSFIMSIVLLSLILMGLSDIAKDVAVQSPA